MDTATRIEQLIDNDYAQQQLRDGIENLRGAYKRASKRPAKAARDERLRRQVQSGFASIKEAADAFGSNRRKPKPRWGRRLVVLAAISGVAVAIAANKDDPGQPG